MIGPLSHGSTVIDELGAAAAGSVAATPMASPRPRSRDAPNGELVLVVFGIFVGLRIGVIEGDSVYLSSKQIHSQRADPR